MLLGGVKRKLFSNFTGRRMRRNRPEADAHGRPLRSIIAVREGRPEAHTSNRQMGSS